MRVRLSALVAVVLYLGSGLPARAGPADDAAAKCKQGKSAEAIPALEKATTKNPSDCAALKALGDCYFAASDADLGALTYERFLKACPNHAEAQKVASALAAHYDKLAGPEPPPNAGPDGLYRVPLPPRQTVGGRTEDDAWAYERDSRVERLTKVEEAIELMRAGKHADAVKLLKKYLKDEPKDAQGWRFLGTAQADNGNPAGAVEAYEKYLALEPKAPDAAPIRQSVEYFKKKK
ncbi:MAG: tetratricopeptide repeat protein [Myxococcales bacterium]|jgi:cytochrome c-type biogenesis protein CcmH/NrfG